MLKMRRFLFLTFFLSLFCSFANAQEEILQELERVLENKETYIRKKHERIAELKRQVGKFSVRQDKDSLYRTYFNLSEEYQSFKYDSAYYYLEKAKNIAYQAEDQQFLPKARIKEGFILLSAGLFKEAIDTLNTVDIEPLSEEEKFEYHYVKARSFYDLADYTKDPRFSTDYIRKGNKEIQKALDYTNPNSSEYWAAESLRRMKHQDWQGAKFAFTYWINNFDLTPEYKGVANSSLGYIYGETGYTDKAIQFLALAAIADVKNAIMENVALRNLAKQLFTKGEVEKANQYIRVAMDDASFYKARHRKLEISSILPIIEGTQLLKIEEQNSKLQAIAILLGFLSFMVLIFLVIIIKQLKARNQSRKALTDSYARLQELNENLQESDAVKQEYIRYFLGATADLLKKIDRMQKRTTQKILSKKPAEVLKDLKKLSVKKEREAVYKEFDQVFIKLFPSFKEDFNALFPKDQLREEKMNGTLSTEQRIYALHRLGVKDANQIAEFLDLTVATIYSYKTRIKSRSLCRNDFENKIMEIKSLENQ